MNEYKLKAIQKTNKLYNVVDGNNNLVRAKCSFDEVKNIFRNGLYYAIDYKYL